MILWLLCRPSYIKPTSTDIYPTSIVFLFFFYHLDKKHCSGFELWPLNIFTKMLPHRTCQLFGIIKLV